MKKIIIILALALMAVPALAQIGGLPLADTAAPSDQGLMRLTAGWTHLSTDVKFDVIGARFTYGLLERLALSADVGYAMPDAKTVESAFAMQGLVKWCFAVPQLPLDLAVRAGISQVKFKGKTNADADAKVFNMIGGVVVSKDITTQITPYGMLSLSHSTTKYSGGFVGTDDDSSTDVGISGGLLFGINDKISLYAEVSYISDMIFGLGGRYTF